MFIFTRKKLREIVDERIEEHLNGEHEPGAISYEPVPEDQLTDQVRADVAEALQDLVNGNYSGPFSTDEQIEDHFANL